jgi:hypothetical protein
MVSLLRRSAFQVTRSVYSCGIYELLLPTNDFFAQRSFSGSLFLNLQRNLKTEPRTNPGNDSRKKDPTRQVHLSVPDSQRKIATGKEVVKIEVSRPNQSENQNPKQAKDDDEDKDPLQLEIANIPREDLVKLVEALDLSGVSLMITGTSESLTDAIKQIQKSLVIKRNSFQDEMPEIYDTLVMLGTLHRKRAQEEDRGLADEAFHEVRRIGQEIGTYEASPEPTTGATDLAAMLEKAALKAIPDGGGDDEGLVAALTAAAYMFISRPDPKQQKRAIHLYKEAIRAEKRRHGEDHHGAAEISALLATTHLILGEHDEAAKIQQTLKDLVRHHPEKAFDKTKASLESLTRDLSALGYTTIE